MQSSSQDSPTSSHYTPLKLRVALNMLHTRLQLYENKLQTTDGARTRQIALLAHRGLLIQAISKVQLYLQDQQYLESFRQLVASCDGIAVELGKILSTFQLPEETYEVILLVIWISYTSASPSHLPEAIVPELPVLGEQLFYLLHHLSLPIPAALESLPQIQAYERLTQPPNEEKLEQTLRAVGKRWKVSESIPQEVMTVVREMVESDRWDYYYEQEKEAEDKDFLGDCGATTTTATADRVTTEATFGGSISGSNNNFGHIAVWKRHLSILRRKLPESTGIPILTKSRVVFRDLSPKAPHVGGPSKKLYPTFTQHVSTKPSAAEAAAKQEDDPEVRKERAAIRKRLLLPKKPKELKPLVPEKPPLTTVQQRELIDKLYTKAREHNDKVAEKRQAIFDKYNQTKVLDTETFESMVTRLYKLPKVKKPSTAPAKSSSPKPKGSSSMTTPLTPTAKASVDRLYSESLRQRVETHQKLVDQYITSVAYETTLKLTPEQVKATAERLTAKK